LSEGGASEKNGGECEVVWWWRWRGLRAFVNWLFSDFHGGIFKFSASRVLGIFRKMCIDLWGVAGMMLSQSTWCVQRIICFINLRNTLSGMSYNTELLRSYHNVIWYCAFHSCHECWLDLSPHDSIMCSIN
jgi:hypothetical protein